MTPGFDVPFLLGMMRLSDSPALSDPRILADWIEARLDEGLVWFDHADTYGDRRCEMLFGEALALRPALKPRIRVVTKAGVVLRSRDSSRFGVKHYDTSPAYLGKAIDASLSRLGVERLDHFLVQRPDPLMDVNATAHALDAAIAAGKVGAVGVSNFLPEQWRRLQQAMANPLAVHQLELSLAHPDSLFSGLYDAVLSDGHQPMAWSSLGGGSVFEDVLGTAIERIAKELQISHAGLALAWLRRLPGQPIPVIGTLKESRIRELAREGRVDLDRPTWFALLEEARSQRVT
ncbi:aldo/keto reductase [Halomonas sp. McH1-25]|uniref:aldo/keto reductase n=1 Tax=unclassified Halomonas TaxID=2609666 RepID=UPI001EF53CC4|nr:MULTISPECIES: aldo/keto reductase [unclassified Halomonas]MCG7600561.1 aldo/keto reductase [Halomonas sp. McH1-25]MCP1342028.1 aldo/keto reductase [Halomonas sp. FL8]MCP1361996.1 aldo/keto reductase [Halomonas sp. BBD45]MCP1364647.1 aldo/keto reductase [Halomonas sp. BBD48]